MYLWKMNHLIWEMDHFIREIVNIVPAQWTILYREMVNLRPGMVCGTAEKWSGLKTVIWGK